MIYQQFLQRDYISRFSIWKQETDVKMSVFRRKQIDVLIDVISDVNLCYSEFARKYLADTGLPKERTYMTGSPMAEVLHMNLEKIQKSDVLDRLGLEKVNTFCFLRIVRKILIQRRIF